MSKRVKFTEAEQAVILRFLEFRRAEAAAGVETMRKMMKLSPNDHFRRNLDYYKAALAWTKFCASRVGQSQKLPS